MKKAFFLVFILTILVGYLKPCYAEPVNMKPGLWQVCTHLDAPGAYVEGEIQSGMGSGIFCDIWCIEKENLDGENVTIPIPNEESTNCQFDDYSRTGNTNIKWKSICKQGSGSQSMVGEVTYSGATFESEINSFANFDLPGPGAGSSLPVKMKLAGEFILNDCSKKNDPQIRSKKPTPRILAKLRSKAADKKTTSPDIKEKPTGSLSGGIDFSSSESMLNTCSHILQASADSLKDDDSKLAFSICDSIEMTKRVWNLIEGQRDWRGSSGPESLSKLRGELSYLLGEIKKNRKMLQSVKLSSPAMTIYPGNWSIDFNGDGEITPFERYFFWVPKRGVYLPRSPRGADIYETYYENTKINIDESDINWAIAYCHIGEAVLNILLSYDQVFVNGHNNILLVDEKRMRNEAYPSALNAIKYSKKLRESLLNERDDSWEWIPNADQKNTVFPITMNKQLFETWGDILNHLEALLQGRTLWGGQFYSSDTKDLINLTFDLCSPREGINIKNLFENPIENFEDPMAMKSRCLKPSKDLPMSSMYQTLSEVFLRNSTKGADGIFNELSIARYIYWIN